MGRGTLLRTALAVGATALAGGAATDPGSDWYRSLRKPRWQPPPPAYGLVWTPLYAALAVISARALDGLAAEGRPAERAAYARALGVDLALNAGWNVLFFRARRPWLAAAECAVLTGSAADLVRRTRSVDRRAALALAPYPAWCAFATALTVAIARRN
jgi:tryptophan-rich sensory protein